jgi:2-dehydro-3-deoxygalactonokinase
MCVITIDAGTSNTRVTLWHKGQSLSYAVKAVGCRDTAITGSREKLRAGVKEGLEEVIAKAGIMQKQIHAVIASGMITSNMGLHEIPHLSLPAGKKELAQAMVCVDIPEVWHKPIWFIPGLKSSGSSKEWNGISTLDIMRGEETEAVALMERLELKGPAWIVLPGSHSKYLYINDAMQIEYSLTTLAGELYSAISTNTILANSVNVKNISGTASEDLLAGAKMAKEIGLGRACFMVRLAHLFSNKSETQRGDFLLGAVLSSDIHILKQADDSLNTAAAPVIIAGRKELRTAIRALLAKEAKFKERVLEVSDQVVQDLAGCGALVLAKQRGIIS